MLKGIGVSFARWPSGTSQPLIRAGPVAAGVQGRWEPARSTDSAGSRGGGCCPCSVPAPPAPAGGPDGTVFRLQRCPLGSGSHCDRPGGRCSDEWGPWRGGARATPAWTLSLRRCPQLCVSSPGCCSLSTSCSKNLTLKRVTSSFLKFKIYYRCPASPHSLPPPPLPPGLAPFPLAITTLSSVCRVMHICSSANPFPQMCVISNCGCLRANYCR